MLGAEPLPEGQRVPGPRSGCAGLSGQPQQEAPPTWSVCRDITGQWQRPRRALGLLSRASAFILGC